MSVRRRIGWAVAAIFGPLLVAFAAAPYLVDVESYKPSLIEAVKGATGRELVIDGPMKLSVFPVPRISAQRVHFANAAGATGAQMVDVRWIGASPSWRALLQGSIEVGRVTLYQPTIVLETDANGVPNWQFQPGAGADQPGRARRRLPSRARRASYRAGHDQLHQSADRADIQSPGCRGDGVSRLAERAVLDRRQRHRERRAAVARFSLTAAPRPADMRPTSA